MGISSRVNLAVNFLEQGTEDWPNEDFLNRPDVYYDLRNNMLSEKCDFSNLQWYLNYMKSNVRYASRNFSAYPSYLLNLGFIPVIFLPMCYTKDAPMFHEMINSMFHRLDNLRIPYIKTAGYSFVLQRPAGEQFDAWVSKLDIERLFQIPLRQITSEDIVRRLFIDNVTTEELHYGD